MMQEKKGVAMIVVLVMIIVFSSLILAVILSSTAAIKRAGQYRDKAIALHVAEAGMQDFFYWINYRG